MATPSGVVAFANLGTSSTQVIAADSSRRSITFHNPNTATNANIVVCPAFDNSANALTASFSAPGGSYVLYPGAEKKFEGNVQTAWLAAASTGTTNGVTMVVERG
jgi:hypothetical protein